MDRRLVLWPYKEAAAHLLQSLGERCREHAGDCGQASTEVLCSSIYVQVLSATGKQAMIGICQHLQSCVPLPTLTATSSGRCDPQVTGTGRQVYPLQTASFSMTRFQRRADASTSTRGTTIF